MPESRSRPPETACCVVCAPRNSASRRSRTPIPKKGAPRNRSRASFAHPETARRAVCAPPKQHVARAPHGRKRKCALEVVRAPRISVSRRLRAPKQCVVRRNSALHRSRTPKQRVASFARPTAEKNARPEIVRAPPTQRDPSCGAWGGGGNVGGRRRRRRRPPTWPPATHCACQL